VIEPRAAPGRSGEREFVGSLHRTRPDRAIVHAVRAFRPQLDCVDPQTIAAPVRRSRHRASRAARCNAETRSDLAHTLTEHIARLQRLALGAGPGGDPAVERAAREVLVALAVRRADDRPFDAHLPMQRVPVKDRCSARSRRELVSLARLVIREEDDVAGGDVDALAQNHARGRLAAACSRREDHCVRIGLRTAHTRLTKPFLEQRHGIGG
jgi:hypothetical protein